MTRTSKPASRFALIAALALIAATPALAAPRRAATAEPERLDNDPGGPAARPERLASHSVTIRSSCSHTVKMRYDDTIASLSSNEVDTRSLEPGDKVAVLDDSEHALDSITVRESTREVVVGSSCSSVSER